MLKKLQQLLFYSIILFLPTQLGRHFWPSWSYVSGIRIDYLSPTIYVTDIFIVALFVLWMLSNLKYIKFKFTIYHLPFTIFFLSILAGIFFSKNPQAGLYGLFKLLEFGFFGWYVSTHIKTIVDMQRIVLLFSCGVIFESSLSIAQYLHQGSIGGLFYFFGERTFTSSTPGIANASLDGRLVLRPYATFPHPNVLAGYLIIVMTTIISNFKFLISNQSRLNRDQILNFKKLIIFASLLFGTMALFLTMSRVAIVLWIAIMFLFLFKNLNIKNSLKIKNYKLKIYVVVVVTILIIFMYSPFHFRFSDFRFTEESAVKRIELINAAVAMIKENPLIGVGLNNFLPNLSLYQKSTGQSLFSYLQPAHNIFFLVTAETGLVGLGIFLWFMRKTYKKIMNKKFIIHYSLFIILMLGMFDHYFLTLQSGQLLCAFVFGLCWSRSIS